MLLNNSYNSAEKVIKIYSLNFNLVQIHFSPMGIGKDILHRYTNTFLLEVFDCRAYRHLVECMQFHVAQPKHEKTI